MENIVAIIDRIIEEHKVIASDTSNLEKVANDAEALIRLEEGKEAFIAGRLNEAQGLRKLEEMSIKFEEGLNAHFKHEEKQLLEALKNRYDVKLVSAFKDIFSEHEALRERLGTQKKEVAELLTGKLSRHYWQAKASDMRNYMTHTHKLIGEHAKNESILLKRLRDELSK